MWLPVAVLAMVAVAAVGWAVVTVQTAAAPAPPPRDFVTAAAAMGSVEEERTLRAEARWDRTLVARNVRVGTVTSVAVDGTRMIESGSELYAVDLQPVFVAEGTVPAFRDLAEKAEGRDVQQLQTMLALAGELRGVPDGQFGAATTAAVKRWQQREGIEPTGVVTAGQVLFAPDLPAKLAIDTAVAAPGMQVSGGEGAILRLSTEPRIEAQLSAQALGSIPPNAAVTLTAGGATWNGKVEKTETQEGGGVVASLVARDGSSCGTSCPFSPSADDRLQLQGKLFIVPKTYGVIIPTAAIWTKEGKQFVTEAAGRKRSISVQASAGGKSVVAGISAGSRVRIPS